MGYEEMAADGGYGQVGSDENRRVAEMLEHQDQLEREEEYRAAWEEERMMEEEMDRDRRIAALEAQAEKDREMIAAQARVIEKVRWWSNFVPDEDSMNELDAILSRAPENGKVLARGESVVEVVGKTTMHHAVSLAVDIPEGTKVIVEVREVGE